MTYANTTRYTAIVLATALVLLGCGKSDDSKDDTPTDDSPVAKKAQAGETETPATPAAAEKSPAAEPDEPPAPAAPRGLEAEDNNPALIELAKPIAECEVDASYPSNSCTETVMAFIKAMDEEKDMPTLVNLLEDPSAKVRFLATRVMSYELLMQKRAAQQYAMRVAAVAAAETDVAIAKLMGGVLLQGPFKDKAYSDAIAAMFEAHALPEMRASIAKNLSAQDNERFIPLMKKRFAEENDKDVKLAILSGFYTTDGVCEWLLPIVDDPDNDIAGRAGYNIVWTSGECKDHYDAFNEKFAARIESKKFDRMFLLSTMYMAEAKGATDAQKQAFIDMLKPIVEDTTLSGMTRSSALKTIGEHGKDGKTYARKFRKDPDNFVSGAAKDIK
jgi:hypothetical protein